MIFVDMDLNRDGEIDILELTQILQTSLHISKEEVIQVLRILDVTGSQTVTATEWLSYLVIRKDKVGNETFDSFLFFLMDSVHDHRPGLPGAGLAR